jgi:hypothetical protein
VPATLPLFGATPAIGRDDWPGYWGLAIGPGLLGPGYSGASIPY